MSDERGLGHLSRRWIGDGFAIAAGMSFVAVAVGWFAKAVLGYDFLNVGNLTVVQWIFSVSAILDLVAVAVLLKRSHPMGLPLAAGSVLLLPWGAAIVFQLRLSVIRVGLATAACIAVIAVWWEVRAHDRD